MTYPTQTDRALASMFAGTPNFLGLLERDKQAPFMAEPLSATAIQIGEEKLCGDLNELADFLAGSENEREDSQWFGAISVQELVEVMFAAKHHERTVFQAVQELRKRFIEDKSEYVLREAMKASEA